MVTTKDFNTITKNLKTEIVTLTNKRKYDYGDRISIVDFFLKLYKFQSNAPKKAPAQFIPVDPEDRGPDHTYQLFFQRSGKWESRRMTITQLGEGSSSKSKCFKIIFDDLFVIKIPPTPITSFDEYMECIRSERRIASRLAPNIEFVAPGVAAILKKVHAFYDKENYTPLELEEEYLKWLERNPRFKEFLKIGNAYVFFMDLSRYTFLSTLIDKIHVKGVLQEEVRNEIVRSHEVLWDLLGFEDKFGSDQVPVCLKLSKIYSIYESQVRALMKKFGITSSVSGYELQKWFVGYLADNPVTENRRGLPEQFINGVNNLLTQIMGKHQSDVDAYRETVRNYIHRLTFDQNKTPMGSIIANILELLAGIREKGLSIRDLKPDNVFVVGDTEKFPLALSSAEDYSLGLIDFETAVEFEAMDQKQIPQPLLAGTPSYATPSHLFPNPVLISAFSNLPRTLWLQDWQAGIGMIYMVVTGESLFRRTSKLLSKIIKIAQKHARDRKSLFEVFKYSSRIFWSSALGEFQDKMAAHDKLLRSVDVIIPESAMEMLREDVILAIKGTEMEIRRYISSQVIFSSARNKKNLIRYSTEEVERLKTKWEKGIGIPKTSPVIRKQIIRLLRDLYDLKMTSKTYLKFLKSLTEPVPRLSAYELLNVMFNVVLQAMYKTEWGKLDASTGRTGIADAQETSSEEKTMIYEATILYDPKP